MGRIKETKEGSIRELRPELRKLVEQYISSDEEILLCCGTEEEEKKIGIIFTSHLPAYLADIITARQLVHARYDTFSWGVKYARSNRLVDITSISLESGYDYYSVSTHVGGESGIYCTFASLQISKKFADTLQRAIEQAKAISTVGTHTTSFIDELERLNSLHKQGGLTDEEFELAKRKLLS